ncbi:MAG: cupredoxin domain-containing protein [Actinomycetota bacterium]
MSRKALISVLAAAALVGAACAKQAPPTLNQGTGERFIPSVVDYAKDVGGTPSIVLDGEGNPMVAYAGFNQVLAEGDIADTRPLHLPAVPNILFADIQGDGYWNVGAVAWHREVGEDPNGDLNLVELSGEEPDVKQTPLPNVGVSAAVDDTGSVHVVWTDREGVKYANDSGGAFEPETVARSPMAYGASIATDAAGAPWIAYYDRGVAWASTLDERGHWTRWLIDKVDICAECQNARTAIAVGRDGAAVLYTDGRSPILTTTVDDEQEGPTLTTVEPGGGGWGASLVLADDGKVHAAYYSSTGDVKQASGQAGSDFAVADVAPGSDSEGSIFGWSTGIALDDEGTEYVTWYDLPSNSVKLARGTGGKLEEVKAAATDGGDSPSIAVSGDGAKVFIAWYDRENGDLQVGTLTSSEEVPIARPSPSPVQDEAAPPLPAAECEPTVLAVTAPAGAVASGFDLTCLAAEAGKGFKIQFANDDTAPHNVAVYTDQSATTPIFENTEAVDPGASATYSVDAQKPGQYFFNCYFHPTTMTGTLVVA